jgi:glucosamine-6-phosphate deaminase
LGTIARLSRQVSLVIHGDHKGEAVRRLAGYGDFNSAWPATLIFRCRKPQLWLDEAAAIGLEA